MKKLPVAIRFIINIIFFIIYSLAGIIFGNFIYGFILNAKGKIVPGSSDPIHLKIAGVIVLVLFISTIVLRKYFYISLESNDNDKLIKDEKDEEMKIYVDKEIK